jgi:hypothetical protein
MSKHQHSLTLRTLHLAQTVRLLFRQLDPIRMLRLAFVFIGEHAFQSVRLMFGNDKTCPSSVMGDQKLFAAALASDGSHRLESFWHLRLELPTLDRNRVPHLTPSIAVIGPILAVWSRIRLRSVSCCTNVNEAHKI